MVCKADTGMYTSSGMDALRPVGFAATRVTLHRSARSRGYKLSREGADPRSLLRGGVRVLFLHCCLNRGPYLPFYSF
jgi:hypothetical protein